MEKKSTTISIVNDKDGNNLKSFEDAARYLSIEYRVVTQLHEGLLDISVKHTTDAELFNLGCGYQFNKMQKFGYLSQK